MKVLILAAGYGTRLYPYTKNYPKPLLKIGKRPIINHLLDKIKELSNISGIRVVTNGKFFKQFKAWKSNLSIKYPVRIINDLTRGPKDKLGAVGDMNLIFKADNFKGNFLVLGGDNLFKDSLSDFMRFARAKSPYVSVGLFDIGDKKQASYYGVVNLDKKNRIVKFCEKPLKPKSSLVAMCLYYFPQAKLGLIKDYLGNPANCPDQAGAYISWLSQKDKVYGFVFKNFWFDIGDVDSYKKVGGILKEKE
ncbi:MAG: nucleotidyltransferase family protein [Candidatus Omnitrophota bacterium]